MNISLIKNRNLFYPFILVIFPHLFLIWWWGRFPLFLIEGIAGIFIGIMVQVLILRYKADLTLYFPKIVLSVLVFILWLVVVSRFGIPIPLHAVMLLPAVITSAYWLITIKNPIDKLLLMLINPQNYTFIFWIVMWKYLSERTGG